MSQLTINGQELKRLINHTAFTTAADDNRPVLAGVHLETKDSVLSLAATDGFRLAVASSPLAECDEGFAALVPGRVLVEVAKAIKKSDAPITLSTGGGGSPTAKPNQILFSGAGLAMTSRLIDGVYPLVRGLIPASFKSVATVNREELLSAVKRANVFAKCNNDVVTLTLVNSNYGDDTIEVAGNASEHGNVRSTLTDVQVEGPGVRIAFSGIYLHSVANVYDSEYLALEMNDLNNPGVFRPVGEDAVSVVMPMHLAN